MQFYRCLQARTDRDLALTFVQVRQINLKRHLLMRWNIRTALVSERVSRDEQYLAQHVAIDGIILGAKLDRRGLARGHVRNGCDPNRCFDKQLVAKRCDLYDIFARTHDAADVRDPQGIYDPTHRRRDHYALKLVVGHVQVLTKQGELLRRAPSTLLDYTDWQAFNRGRRIMRCQSSFVAAL